MHDKRYRTYQVSLEEPLNKQNGKEGQDDLRIAQFSTKIMRYANTHRELQVVDQTEKQNLLTEIIPE